MTHLKKVFLKMDTSGAGDFNWTSFQNFNFQKIIKSFKSFENYFHQNFQLYGMSHQHIL